MPSTPEWNNAKSQKNLNSYFQVPPDFGHSAIRKMMKVYGAFQKAFGFCPQENCPLHRAINRKGGERNMQIFGSIILSNKRRKGKVKPLSRF
tara:strand:- start:71 stop:346 length:276 start_codon:yes stop_codon:yes gene_type:complete